MSQPDKITDDDMCDEHLSDSDNNEEDYVDDEVDPAPEYTAEDYSQLFDQDILQTLAAECRIPLKKSKSNNLSPYRMRIGTDESPLRVSQLFGIEELELAYYETRSARKAEAEAEQRHHQGGDGGTLGIRENDADSSEQMVVNDRAEGETTPVKKQV